MLWKDCRARRRCTSCRNKERCAEKSGDFPDREASAFCIHTLSFCRIHRWEGGMQCERLSVFGGRPAAACALHRAGCGGGLSGAAGRRAAHPADALRYGGGHHAGRQCVEPAPARHRAGRGRAAAGLAGPGSGACAGRCGLAAAGRSRRAADARRREGAWPDGPGRAGCDPPQSAGGDGGGPCGGAGAAGRAGGRQRGAGPCAGHRLAEHPGGRGGEPAAGTGRAGEAESLLRRASWSRWGRCWRWPSRAG